MSTPDMTRSARLRSGSRRRMAAGSALLILGLAVVASGCAEQAAVQLLQGVPGPGISTASSAADGNLTDPLEVTDTDEPAIARLDPDLLAALEDAATDAAQDGIDLRVTSGWRSKTYQQQLLDEAIKGYGSRQEALRWVAAPDRSAHVTGDAVDVGPTDAAYWLQQHGSTYGLCQTYGNEIWHYQLMVAPGGTCPAPLPDAAG